MKMQLGGFADSCWRIYLTAVILIFALACGDSAAQKSKKPKSGNGNGPVPTLPVPDADQIDHDIGEMLGAFQVGNVEAMHKYYSDDVTFVSGVYEPPLVGWENYVAMYQRERAAFQGMQLIRRNTNIFTHGDVAWASYQWEFLSTLNGKAYSAQGQTTLVLTKTGDNWMIVHNHTSQICPVCPVASQPTQQPPAENENAPAPEPEAPKQ